MKAASVLAITLWVGAFECRHPLVAASVPPAPVRPNFLVLIGEGQGWSSLSIPMDDQVPGSRSDINLTPNLDRLAREGMRFAHFVSPSPRCTPSRASLFTGKSPAQLHMTFVGEGRGDDGTGQGTRVIPAQSTTELPLSETTIAELLQSRGYATAHFGKWHVGRTDPSRHGYGESTGPTSNGGPDNTNHPNPVQAYASATLADGFMTRAAASGRPFYLQVAQYAGKSAMDARPDTLAAVQARLGGRELPRHGVAAVAEDADITYGMMLRRMEELGVLTNTYVIYLSDHGAPGRNPPLSGGKGTISEGGLRVPLIIRGPGVQAGVISRQRVTGVDVFPTIAELAGAPLDGIRGLEGGSLVPVLRSGDAATVRRSSAELVIHFPHYDKDLLGPASALYLGDLKLVRLYETGALRLFDIAADPGEQNDLSRIQPGKALELDRRLTERLTALGAAMPGIRSDPDPSKSAATLPGDRRGGKGGRRGKGEPDPGRGGGQGRTVP